MFTTIGLIGGWLAFGMVAVIVTKFIWDNI
jgi:hypothetical protein